MNKTDIGKLSTRQVEELGELKEVIEIKEENFYKFINEIKFYRMHDFKSTLLPKEITDQLYLINQWCWWKLEDINIHMYHDKLVFTNIETFGDMVLLKFRYRIVK